MQPTELLKNLKQVADVDKNLYLLKVLLSEQGYINNENTNQQLQLFSSNIINYNLFSKYNFFEIKMINYKEISVNLEIEPCDTFLFNNDNLRGHYEIPVNKFLYKNTFLIKKILEQLKNDKSLTYLLDKVNLINDNKSISIFENYKYFDKYVLAKTIINTIKKSQKKIVLKQTKIKPKSKSIQNISTIIDDAKKVNMNIFNDAMSFSYFDSFGDIKNCLTIFDEILFYRAMKNISLKKIKKELQEIQIKTDLQEIQIKTDLQEIQIET